MFGLRGDPKEFWYENERRHPIEEEGTTWKSFVDYLQNLIQNPALRDATVSQQLQEAVQRNNQSARSFDAYIAQLESQLPPMEEWHRVQNYMTKLKPELRGEILKQPNPPTDRAEIVNLASLLEESYKITRRQEPRDSQPRSRGNNT